MLLLSLLLYCPLPMICSAYPSLPIVGCAVATAIPTCSAAMPGMKGRHLGDIVISLEQARIQGAIHPDPDIAAADSLYAEVLFLFIHSMLHLIGYDHETSPRDEQIMSIEQNRIFALTAVG